MESNLHDCILRYWLERMAAPDGGYYGRRDGHDTLHPDAPRGCILNARLLWTLSAAARRFPDRPEYAEAAARQARWLSDHFIDREFGGCFWSTDHEGRPLDTKKQFYAIAFAIYGLTEYYLLTSDREALSEANALFDVIESKSRDRSRGGYLEAATRDWQPIADMRLSDKDMNSSKTMNTHLHILEAYTNLLRADRSEKCLEATRSLLTLFLDRIIDSESNHMGLFFDNDMKRVDGDISYGHDIEASWLLLEAAFEVGDDELTRRTLEATRRMAVAALEGLGPDGSMIYELHADGHADEERHWWVQAECVVGLLWLARYHDLPEYAAKAMEVWRYIERNLVDADNGEWLWSRLPDGTPNRRDDKAGFWKCPYHNGRMVLESTRIISEL
ncbi:MAG: AGE family epimerase/isomerase [Muribaculaceae bacterium]|nr:AGE family epimerase/isomerase [Muribaculaceae bacterium]